MSSTERVCPFCGEPPGAGVFCAACGRNLADVDRLPTRAEWEAGPEAAAADPAADGSLADACASATASFLEAMRAAGCPGTVALQMPAAKPGFFRRTPAASGWMVRPVVWDDRDAPKHHEPGLLLTTEGAFHVVDSQIRGWGQRDFPRFFDTARAETVPMPVERRLVADLDAVLEANGVGSDAS
jgi:hypothetical protein